MIDPITQIILEEDNEQLLDQTLDHILEGYDLKCQQCGKIITIIKDGQGPLECCNNRMIVVVSSPQSPEESEVTEIGVRKALKGQNVDPDFQVSANSANFTPDNQADAEKRQMAKWEKEEKQVQRI